MTAQEYIFREMEKILRRCRREDISPEEWIAMVCRGLLPEAHKRVSVSQGIHR